MQNVSVSDFKSVEKNTLRGFFTLCYGKLLIRDCAFHLKEGRTWFSFPARKVDKADGTSQWVAICLIEDKAHLRKLQDYVGSLVRPLAGIAEPDAADALADGSGPFA